MGSRHVEETRSSQPHLAARSHCEQGLHRALSLADRCPGRHAARRLGHHHLAHERLRASDLARILKALADPTRLRLVSMVAAHEDREACICDLTDPLGLTQPTVSHHLKVLVDAGIFTRDQRGKWAYYALVPAALNALSSALNTSR
jgi:ArsR family transcriptional regulator, arsenate/arsenite/antimonite-responsive transcriptional repressor